MWIRLIATIGFNILDCTGLPLSGMAAGTFDNCSPKLSTSSYHDAGGAERGALIRMQKPSDVTARFTTCR